MTPPSHLPPDDGLRRRQHDAWSPLHRAWRWLSVRADGPLARLSPAQREQLLAGQFEASRTTFMGMLATGALLLLVLVVMEAGGWLPGIGYPMWATALGAPVLALLGHQGLYGAHAWVRVPSLLAYGGVIAALVSFPLDEGNSHLLVRSELFNLFMISALVLSTRRRTIIAAIAFILSVSLLRLRLYGPPWSGPAIYWLIVSMHVTFGLVLRRFRLDLAAQALVMGERLREEARTDALTGLPNRAGWERAARAAFERVRDTDAGACCLFIDVDHFKRINDTHGHAVGDEILRRLGAALARTCPPGAVCARLGGEEFVLLLPGADVEAARATADAVRHAFSDAAAEYGVTASIGIARNDAGESLAKLMRRADAALYAAKGGGRDRVVIAGADEQPELATA